MSEEESWSLCIDAHSGFKFPAHHDTGNSHGKLFFEMHLILKAHLSKNLNLLASRFFKSQFCHHWTHFWLSFQLWLNFHSVLTLIHICLVVFMLDYHCVKVESFDKFCILQLRATKLVSWGVKKAIASCKMDLFTYFLSALQENLIWTIQVAQRSRFSREKTFHCD